MNRLQRLSKAHSRWLTQLMNGRFSMRANCSSSSSNSTKVWVMPSGEQVPKAHSLTDPGYERTLQHARQLRQQQQHNYWVMPDSQ
jgi:hypothetical protein